MKSTVFGIFLAVSISLSFWAPVTEADPPTVKVFHGEDRKNVNNEAGTVLEGKQTIPYKYFPDQRGIKEIYGSGEVLLHEGKDEGKEEGKKEEGKKAVNKYRPTAEKNQVILNVGKGMNGIGTVLTFGKNVLDLIEENNKSQANGRGEVFNFKKAFVIVTREATTQEDLDQNELRIRGKDGVNSDYFDKELKGTQKEKVDSIMNGTATPINDSVQKIVKEIEDAKKNSDKNRDDFIKALGILNDIMKEAGGLLYVIWLESSDTDLVQNELRIRGENGVNSDYFDKILKCTNKDKVDSIMNGTANDIPPAVVTIVTDIKNETIKSDKKRDDFNKTVAEFATTMKSAGGELVDIWLDSKHKDLSILLGKLKELGLNFDSVLYMFEGVAAAGIVTSEIFPKAHLNLHLSKHVKAVKGIHYLANDISAFKGAKGPAGLFVQADETLSVAGLYPEQEDAKFLVVTENTETARNTLKAGTDAAPRNKERIVAFVKSDKGADFKGSYDSLTAFKTALSKCKAGSTVTKMTV